MGRIRHVVLVLAVAAAPAGCSGDDGASTPATSAPATSTTAGATITSGGSSTTTSTTRTPTTTTGASTTTAAASTTTAPAGTTTTTTAACPGPPFARVPREDTTVPASAALLNAVRIAGHDCYDRVVFEFRGPSLPEWRVEPADPPFSGPSGLPVTVLGTSWLHVRFGTANAHTDDGEATVGIAPVPLGDTTVLRQVQLIEDFEAVVVYVIGMDSARPFRVLTFADPPRLAIDVRTG